MRTDCLTRNTIITTTTNIRRRFWERFVSPHMGLLWLALPFMALVAGASFAYPLLVEKAFGFLETKNAKILTLIPLALIAVATMKALALFIQILLTNALALRTVRDLQSAMFAHLQDLDLAQITAEAGGLLVSRFTNDVNLAKEALVRASNNLIKDSLTIFGALGYMFWSNWQLALIILVVYPVATLPIVWLGKRVRALSQAAQKQIGELTALLSENISGTQMVRAYQLQDQEQTRANNSFAERYKLAMQLTATKAAIDPFLEILGALALAAALGYAGLAALGGSSAVPELMGFITALGVLAPSARALGTLNAVWQEGMAAITRAFLVLDQSPQIVDVPDAKTLKIKSADIKIEQLDFSYADGTQALSNVSLHAKPGQTLALVGHSGAGKSSLFHLLLRFFEPTGGTIAIEEQDILTVSQQSLRQNISLVSQHPFLFNDTISANIGFGDPTADQNAIIAAAKDAAAFDFIEKLPDGFETIVGENGNRLSGGQRQRIAIARAILKNAPILLLDEATSALDSVSEQKVQSALAKLAKGRTSLVIAHRLSTVQQADQILVLDQGELVESGTHESLLKSGKIYPKLAKGNLQ